jgi:hypothetical protein
MGALATFCDKYTDNYKHVTSLAPSQHENCQSALALGLILKLEREKERERGWGKRGVSLHLVLGFGQRFVLGLGRLGLGRLRPTGRLHRGLLLLLVGRVGGRGRLV